MAVPMMQGLAATPGCPLTAAIVLNLIVSAEVSMSKAMDRPTQPAQEMWER